MQKQKFILSLGLNDKDTKTQIVSDERALDLTQNILREYVDGWTINRDLGGYKHNNGTLIQENTLNIELLFTTREVVITIATRLKHIFNQETIGLQVVNLTGCDLI